MSSAKITLIGFYNYDDTLFDNLTVPTGLDKETLVNNILLRGGEFEVLYANPTFLKSAIGVWSKKWQRTMQKWYDALQVQYRPLENYNRVEETTDTPTGKVKNVTDVGAATGNQTTTSKVSAYDSDAEVNAGSTIVTDTMARSTTNTQSFEDSYHTTHHSEISGNIGVTTSQQMLQSELDIQSWNLYEHITDVFLEEFIIPVY